MIQKLFNYFIPPHFHQEPELLRLAKVSVLFYLFNGISLFLSINMGLMVDSMTIVYINLIYSVISFSLAFLIKFGVPLRVCAMVLASIGTLFVSYMCVTLGGVLSVIVFGFMFVPIYYLFLSNDLKGSIFWVVLVLLIIAGFYVYELRIGGFPILIEAGIVDNLYFIVVLTQIATVFILVSIFHIQKDKAVNELIDINDNLKRTQSKLVQSEKLASLGELTAGISHEIQNPLNFVNNFAEVTLELAEELQEEQKKVDESRDSELELELINDIKNNLDKITFHGHRASSIVKGMLEHSRARTDHKEKVDLVALADEYLRLAYHGLRAKDRTFNAEFSVEHDEAIPEVLGFKQDLGRVFLNLINNAFQAVNEKRKNIASSELEFKPLVKVEVRQIGSFVVVSVSDNGIGIKEEIRQKIFQPFYTTKPAGEGTGLGLSLAFDIITTGHDGSIALDSTFGEGSTFTISIPIIE